MANLTQFEMNGDSFGDKDITDSFNIVFLKGGFEECLHLKSLSSPYQEFMPEEL